VPGFHRMYIIY